MRLPDWQAVQQQQLQQAEVAAAVAVEAGRCSSCCSESMVKFKFQPVRACTPLILVTYEITVKFNGTKRLHIRVQDCQAVLQQRQQTKLAATAAAMAI